MHAEDFQLTRAIIELRYDPAFLLWDRAGAMWTAAKEKWPELESEQASPNQTIFTQRASLQLQAELERVVVVHFFPERLNDLNDSVTVPFVRLVNRLLEVDSYSRVGFRLFYRYNTADRDAASQAVLERGFIRLPDTCLGERRRKIDPSVAMKWEDDDTGTRLSFQAKSETQSFRAPPGYPDIEPQDVREVGAIVDVDHYTRGVVTTGQLELGTWLRDRYRETAQAMGELLE